MAFVVESEGRECWCVTRRGRAPNDWPSLQQRDHRNRLTKVIHADGSETCYEYCGACPLGKLAKMTRTDGSAVEWAWDGISFIEENDSREAWPSEYLGSLAVKKHGDWYYLHTDVMGTVWQVTDEAGQVVNEFNWDAWENELTGTFGQPGAVCQIGWQVRHVHASQPLALLRRFHRSPRSRRADLDQAVPSLS